uniref:Im:7152348 n=1 Tax=Oreochromis niloticus TaxID=8128 RepID=A0A669BRI3_ORENI
MVLCEDGDCSVCLLPYSREERIPRVLHCRHTFCDSCLERMSTERNGLLTVGCPLCRRVTCIGRGRGLREALWVNSELWDQIPEDVDIREEEEEEEGEKQTEVQSDEATPGENRAWQQCVRSEFVAFIYRLLVKMITYIFLFVSS